MMMLCSDAIETSENVSYSTVNNTSRATTATPASVAGLASENGVEYAKVDGVEALSVPPGTTSPTSQSSNSHDTHYLTILP